MNLFKPYPSIYPSKCYEHNKKDICKLCLNKLVTIVKHLDGKTSATYKSIINVIKKKQYEPDFAPYIILFEAYALCIKDKSPNGIYGFYNDDFVQVFLPMTIGNTVSLLLSTNNIVIKDDEILSTFITSPLSHLFIKYEIVKHENGKYVVSHELKDAAKMIRGLPINNKVFGHMFLHDPDNMDFTLFNTMKFSCKFDIIPYNGKNIFDKFTFDTDSTTDEQTTYINYIEQNSYHKDNESEYGNYVHVDEVVGDNVMLSNLQALETNDIENELEQLKLMDDIGFDGDEDEETLSGIGFDGDEEEEEEEDVVGDIKFDDDDVNDYPDEQPTADEDQ